MLWAVFVLSFGAALLSELADIARALSRALGDEDRKQAT